MNPCHCPHRGTLGRLDLFASNLLCMACNRHESKSARSQYDDRDRYSTCLTQTLGHHRAHSPPVTLPLWPLLSTAVVATALVMIGMTYLHCCLPLPARQESWAVASAPPCWTTQCSAARCPAGWPFSWKLWPKGTSWYWSFHSLRSHRHHQPCSLICCCRLLMVKYQRLLLLTSLSWIGPILKSWQAFYWKTSSLDLRSGGLHPRELS